MILLTLAVASLALVAARAAATPTRGDAAPGPAAASSAEQQAAAARHRRGRRHGCSRFCRQAGGFGAPPDSKNVVRVGAQTIRIDHDGIIGVRAECLLETTCDGAILVDGRVAYGRADLRIPAGKTRTVYVLVPRSARRYLRRRGRDGTAYATVPLKGDHPVSISRRLTLLPQR